MFKWQSWSVCDFLLFSQKHAKFSIRLSRELLLYSSQKKFVTLKIWLKQKVMIQAKISTLATCIPGLTNHAVSGFSNMKINWRKGYKILPRRTESRNYQVNYKQYLQILHKNKIYADIVKFFYSLVQHSVYNRCTPCKVQKGLSRARSAISIVGLNTV